MYFFHFIRDIRLRAVLFLSILVFLTGCGKQMVKDAPVSKKAEPEEIVKDAPVSKKAEPEEMVKDAPVTKKAEPEKLNTFIAAIGGQGRQSGSSMQRTSDGGYILLGETSNGPDPFDMYLVKVTIDGDEPNVLWERSFKKHHTEYAHSLRQTSDGGYALAGETFPNRESRSDMLIVKTDSDGNLEWSKALGGAETEIAWSVEQAYDGGYVLAGNSFSEIKGENRLMYALKTDKDGNIDMAWGNQDPPVGMSGYNGRGTGIVHSSDKTKDGGYVFAGQASGSGADGDYFDMYLVKTDEKGKKEWSKSFNVDRNVDSANSVIQTSDGGYVMAGTTYLYASLNKENEVFEILVIKTDADGNEEWRKVFGSEATDRAKGVRETADGGFAVLWNSEYTQKRFGRLSINPNITKISKNGDELWTRKIEAGTSISKGNSLEITDDGGILILGMLNGMDMLLIKTDAEGNIFNRKIIYPAL